MDFDDMLIELGELGKFQITTYTLICIPVIFAAANSLTYVFTAGVPDYRCYVPGCEEPNNTEVITSWVQNAIPELVNNPQDNYMPEYCTRYKRISNNSSSCENAHDFSDQTEKCDAWIFNEEKTIVNEWNVTCKENQWKLAFVGTSHFAGIIVGTSLSGILADRYGRKIVLILSILIMWGFGVAQAFANSYELFTAFIFLNSVGTAGVFPMAFIIGVEMVGRKHREITGIILNYFYAIGEALIALLQWWTMNWRTTQIIVSAPCILFLGYFWLVPESIRWLLANEKRERAKTLVYKVAKLNKVTLSDGLLNSFDEERNALKINEDQGTKEEVTSWTIVKGMCKSRTLVVRFLVVFFIWAVNAFVYYGLSVNATFMAGNKYVNFILVCLVEIPGYTMAWICMKKMGRRKSLVLSLLLSSAMCIIIVVIPSGYTWAIVSLYLIGKLGITSSFGVIFVYTAEMLPTMVRSGGVGLSSTIARVGALLAPFVPLLTSVLPELPMLTFGLFGLAAGIGAFYLPETHGLKLPETVEDAKNI